MATFTIKKPDSHKSRKRVGRGMSSGTGKTCSRGHNGQMSRSGATKRPWFEGGQMPLQRRVPKRGFNNIFKKEYQLVNVSQLEKIDLADITPEALKKAGVIKKADKKIKLLGNGEITKNINISVDAFTKAAKDKIEKAGGKVQIREKKQA